MNNMRGIVNGPNYKSPSFLVEVQRPIDVYLLDIISKAGDKPFLIDFKTKQELTYGNLLDRSFQLAAGLQDLGCKPHSEVGIVSENSLEYPILVLASWLVGASVSCYNPAYTAVELEHTIRIARPAIIFCSSDNYDKVKEVNNRVKCSKHIILLDSGNVENVESTISFSDLLQFSKKKYEKVTNHPDDTAVILYSSGTTGLPKGVMHSHRNMVSMIKIHKDEGINDYEGDITVDTTEIYHVSGFLFNVVSIAKLETRVIMGVFDPEKMLCIIDKYEVQFIHLVPSLIVYILRSLPLKKYDLSSLKYITYAGAPLSIDVEEELRQKMNLKGVRQMFGMTETLTCLVERNNKRKPGTCGSPIPGVQAKIVDTETGEALGPNNTGELCFKGVNIMKGYCGNQKATAEIIDKQGWLHTGDIARYDEDGDFFITGRMKELIKYDGYQVTPWELEEVLMKHQDVQDAAVLGVPDDVMGELPRAYVVKKPNAQVTENDLVEYVAGMVAWYKCLRGGVVFIDEVPRNTKGKILRKNLKEKFLIK